MSPRESRKEEPYTPTADCSASPPSASLPVSRKRFFKTKANLIKYVIASACTIGSRLVKVPQRSRRRAQNYFFFFLYYYFTRSYDATDSWTSYRVKCFNRSHVDVSESPSILFVMSRVFVFVFFFTQFILIHRPSRRTTVTTRRRHRFNYHQAYL